MIFSLKFVQLVCYENCSEAISTWIVFINDLNKLTLEQLNENKEMIDKYKKELTVIRQISSKRTNDASNQTVNIVAPMATRVTNKRWIENLLNWELQHCFSLTRVEKLLTILVVLMAIIGTVEYTREVPWLLINCPGFGKAGFKI